MAPFLSSLGSLSKRINFSGWRGLNRLRTDDDYIITGIEGVPDLSYYPLTPPNQRRALYL